MKITRISLAQMMEILLGSGYTNPRAIRTTKYFSDCLIVRATRRTYGGKVVKGNVEIVVTIGKPNYHEREFIKTCKKAGEPFPVKKIQIKFEKKK